ncbi:MAG: hypothetical protein HC860_09595 [Alkalinema sp. RU_4_3]|nr:hypothetical protein [Alkalinema sp. RU_4_3]
MTSVFPRLLAALLVLGLPTLAQAQISERGTCATQCSKPYLRFRPGQRIKVQVTNHTYKVLQVENALGGAPLNIQPRSTVQFYRGGGTDPNFSVVFWEETETPLRAVPSQIGKDMLKIDLNFAPRRSQGDRSVYLDNDGQVIVL